MVVPEMVDKVSLFVYASDVTIIIDQGGKGISPKIGFSLSLSQFLSERYISGVYYDSKLDLTALSFYSPLCPSTSPIESH